MNFDLTPRILNLTPFKSEGSIVASVLLGLGPITVSAKLVKGVKGIFLSMPSRYSEQNEKWYENASILDYSLKNEAERLAVSEFQRQSQGQLVSV